MDQLHSELDFHDTDFDHQVEQPATPTELSSPNGDTENGDSAPGFSGDVAPVSDPADEAAAEEVVAAVEDTAAFPVDDAAGSVTPVKRKRGRPRKNPEARAVPLVKKKETENVCFVCFDPTNPNLVSCSRRGCYKAYHPACVNRDEDFFRSKVKWNCGWHMCSNCQKAAHYMCYTCTTSYCKECITDESKYVSVRGTYGFCQSCYNTVTLIEQNKLAFENKVDSDFDDTDSFTYLFKAYWLDQKEKLSLTSEELNNARHPCPVAVDEESSDELYDVNNDHGSSSESSSGHHKINISSKRKVKSRSQTFTADKISSKEVDGGATVILPETGWASNELLELVGHMRNGDQSFISQFEVQALLLDYIKKYNLRDPRRKSQIICDLRLRNLFGKERVGHFEMLKLLELHFISKEVQLFAEGDQVEASDPDNKVADDVEEGDMSAKLVSEKRRKNRKRIEETEPQANIDDYAAIDVHNITQIFLRRSLLEELLNDIETFSDKVVGSFVRIRISNAGQRQDLYRLVQVVGTQESPKSYKVGKKTTDIVLEILNLDKKETSTIDTISNQDFTEEECQRLRQSIKCGLIDRLKVGYIQEKAKVLHAVRVNDSIEAEKLRLSHLRDRASETGRRKQLRECVEKLQLLNNPDERRRRLTEAPQIHADPKMDPEYESLEEAEDDKNQDSQINSKEALSLRKRRELIPRGRASNNWNDMHRSPKFNHDSSRRTQGEFGQGTSFPNEALLSQSKELYQSEASFTDLQAPSPRNFAPKPTQQPQSAPPEINPATPNETDKIWFYIDPSNNMQGPFSLTQLRKWSTTGYFPPDMRIWRTSERQEDSILLTDALSGRFYTQHTSLSHQPTRGNWNPQNATQPTLDGLSSQSPGWSQKPAGLVYHNPYHNPALEDSGRGSNGEQTQEQDYANLWSPTRPSGVDTIQVDRNVMSDPPFTNEQNSGINKYRNFESDCPSPTPRTGNLESSSDFADPLGKVNTDSAEASKGEFPRNGMPNLDGSQPAPFGYASNLSPIVAAAVDTGVRMDQTSFQNQFPIVSGLAPPSLHVQVQNPNPNFSPIHQLNPHNAVQVDSSFPSPTPKSNNHTWGNDPSVPSQTVTQLQNANASWAGPPQGNPGWGPPANSGWATPVQMNTNMNPGWNTPPMQMNVNVNANAGWRAPVQMNMNAGWGAPHQGNVNSNPGWGTPVQANTNPNTGWGIPVQANPTGWGTGSTIEAIPAQEDNNVRAGWRSSFGSRNGGWKSSDGETGRRFDHERRNGDGYGHAGRHGGSDPRNNRSQSGGRGGAGGDGRRGVCRFYESGHCKKGTSCQYLHTDLKRDVR